jgi:hypothetical protein
MAQGNVEVWLGSLMNMAQKSLHNVIRQAHFAIGDANFQLLEFLNTFPAQVCVCSQLSFLLTLAKFPRITHNLCFFQRLGCLVSR